MAKSVMIIQPSIFVNGGAERQISILSNYLTDRNWNVAIFSTNVIREFKDSLKEARILSCNSIDDLFRNVRKWGHKYNVINPHNHPAELFVKNAGFNVVWQCNEPPTEVLRGNALDKQEADAVRDSCNYAVVISNYDKQRFKRIYGFDPIVNYPGVNYDYFASEPDGNFDFHGNPILLQTGYFTWTKNQMFTVKMFSEVAKEYRDAILVLAGYDGDQYALNVKKCIKDLGLESKVKIFPYIKSDYEFKKLYYSADVFVSPILEQGGWATTFEAISSGMPTVVSKNFIGSDLIESSNLGVVSDLDNFVENVMKVLENLQEFKSSVRASRSWIRDNLSWKNFCKKYEDILEKFV